MHVLASLNTLSTHPDLYYDFDEDINVYFSRPFLGLSRPHRRDYLIKPLRCWHSLAPKTGKNIFNSETVKLFLKQRLITPSNPFVIQQTT